MLIPPNVEALAERVNAWLRDAHATTATVDGLDAPLSEAAT